MKKLIFVVFLFTIFTVFGCSNNKSVDSLDSPLPATEIITEKPHIVGYITEINTEKQVFYIVENITKDQALNTNTFTTGYWIQMNITEIGEKIKVGNKVAIWKSKISDTESKEQKEMAIAKTIIILEN